MNNIFLIQDFCRPTRLIAFALSTLVLALATPGPAYAEDVSAPAILQWFEASYDTMDRRSADMFLSGYGAVYVPPTGRADLSNFSVGYDVYDRFDLGKPGEETLYGTERGLKKFANRLHQFDGRLQIDTVLNHNAYSDNDYVDPQFTSFAQSGGYPGFVLQNPDGGTDPLGTAGTFGDFHDPAFGGHYLNGQLSGLLDFDHDTNHQLIRHPVTPGDPNNIPAGAIPWVGRLANVPDAANRRFYPDTDLPGTTYWDPKTSQNVTVYPYNSSDSTAGDAVSENALGLLQRYMQWMVQEIGVDGFRIDAAKHMEHFALEQIDTAVYRSNPRLLLDGSQEHVFMYGEVVPGSGQAGGQSNQDFLASYMRKDIDSNVPGTIGGNRDVLDFSLRGELNNNLTFNGVQNDWNNVVNSSMDVHDDGFHNGSAGVQFVSNHDGGGAQLNNVAHAYVLTQPGEAIVYYNADQFDDPNRHFPVDGRGDALGNYGDKVTTLVNIRNTHGRGDYRQRLLEKEYFAMERSGSMLVLLDNRNDVGISSIKTMDVDFPVGTPLVELTGNAAASGQALDEVVVVQNVGGQAKVNVRFLHSGGQDQGYLIYGLQTPQSQNGLVVTNEAAVLAGGTPNQFDVVENAVTRLADLHVVTANTIEVRLETQAVTLPGGIRDQNADGDNAVIRVNNGMDTNGNGNIDFTTPGSVVYGFEEFNASDKSPGFSSPSGDGWYQQSIDATNLPEGYNFVTVRAFRKGVGGPAVFEDYRSVVYLDRVAPESEVVSFSSAPGDTTNRDLVARNTDQTAEDMHFFLDFPASLSDAQILTRALSGQGQADQHDTDSWINDYSNVETGNHVVTIVTFEPSFDQAAGRGFNIQRLPGLFTDTILGTGFGDLNANNSLEASDLEGFGNRSFEDILYSQNSKFEPAADVNGDGLVTNTDLLTLGGELVLGGANQAALDSYSDVLHRRGDVDEDGFTNGADAEALYASFGGTDWLADLNDDGTVSLLDIETLITDLVRTVHGDFDLDRDVDGADFLILQRNMGLLAGARFDQGDANLDGVIDANDFAAWQTHYGFQGEAFVAAAITAIPEPSAIVLSLASILVIATFSRRIP